MPIAPPRHRPVPLTKREPKPDTRGSAHQRGYSAYWRRLRVYWLTRNPQCVVCGNISFKHKDMHVDHIVPIRDGGTNDEENLQTLCGTCHRRKTAKERKGT